MNRLAALEMEFYDIFKFFYGEAATQRACVKTLVDAAVKFCPSPYGGGSKDEYWEEDLGPNWKPEA